MAQPFPEWSKVAQVLDRETVISVLLDYQNKGYSIVYGRPPIINGWTILTENSTRWVAVRPGNSQQTWSVCIGNLGRSVGEVSSVKDLDGYLHSAMQSQGMPISSVPNQVILESNEPISNMSKIISILGSSTIDAIWDAYLANETLETLTNIASLGPKISPNIRILAGERQIQDMVKKSKLTESFFGQFVSQIATQATIKLCKKEHDRFILLNDGRCLSPDFSLNKVSNRGTVNIITDPSSRIKWFEEQWTTGSDWP